MSLRVFLLSFVGLLGCAAALDAQISIPVPPPQCSVSAAEAITCPQGLAFYFDLGEIYEQIAALFAEVGGAEGVTFDYSFAVTGGTLAPGLTVSPSGLVRG